MLLKIQKELNHKLLCFQCDHTRRRKYGGHKNVEENTYLIHKKDIIKNVKTTLYY